MRICFSAQDIRDNKTFGDISLEAYHRDVHSAINTAISTHDLNQVAVISKRSFAKWVVHLLKFNNPFGTYRAETLSDRAWILKNVLIGESSDKVRNLAKHRKPMLAALANEIANMESDATAVSARKAEVNLLDSTAPFGQHK